MSTKPTIQVIDGDGGLAAIRLIRDEILPNFNNPYIKWLEDASRVPWIGEEVVMTSDSFIVFPPIFPGGDIGKLSICGSINDLVASGAVPRFMSFSMILANGLPVETLRQILKSAGETAHQAGIEVICGDTKVLDTGHKDEIIINTTGIGNPLVPPKNFSVRCTKPGDRILVTGTMGEHGLAVLSEREGLGFERRVRSDCAPLHELILPLIQEFPGIHSMRDPTRGGLLNVLIDIAEGSGVDVVVDKTTIPVRHEVNIACEMLGIDPLQLVNEGKMVLSIASEEAQAVLNRLHEHPLGKESAIIGYAQKAGSEAGRLFLKEDGRRKVTLRPEGNKIPRLC